MIKIQAHRGASKERPENCMSAFVRADELGANAIELDVHVLPDRTVVVHHDGYLGRCEENKGPIYNFNKDNVKDIVITKAWSGEYPPEPVPLLTEVLDLLQTSPMTLNCEIKAECCFIETNPEDEVIALLEKYNMRERTIISSFNHRVLKDLKRKYPEYKVGILYGDTHEIDVVDYCLQHRFDAIHPPYQSVDKALVDRCHENGILVNVYTVDGEQDLERMAACGVDSVISNDVVTAKRVLWEK